MQAYNSSSAIHSANKDDDNFQSLANTTGVLPAPFADDDLYRASTEMKNYQDIRALFYGLNDHFCSFKGLSQSINVSRTAVFKEVYLSWDTPCSGNRTLAFEESVEPAKTTFRSQFGLNATGYDYSILFNNCFR